MKGSRPTTISAASLALIALAAGIAFPTTLRRISLDTLIQSSDYIVYGRVAAIQSSWDPGTSAIWTHTTILILDSPKGETGNTIGVTEPGGIVNGRGELYPGAPRFTTGQEVLLFLYRAPGERIRVTGVLQGLYRVEYDPKTGRRMARPAFPRTEAVFEEGRQGASAARAAEGETEDLSRLLYTIRQKVAVR